MAFNIVRDDLLHARADAVVLPSDEQLSLSGGVSAHIAKSAGLLRVRLECMKARPCAVGSAVAIPAFKHSAKYLILTVGPIWEHGSSQVRELLADAYRSSLDAAERLGCQSVAMPLISTGLFGVPPEVSLAVALDVVRQRLEQTDLDITLYLYGADAYVAGRAITGDVVAYIDDNYVSWNSEPLYSQPFREMSQPMPSFSAAPAPTRSSRWDASWSEGARSRMAELLHAREERAQHAAFDEDAVCEDELAEFAPSMAPAYSAESLQDMLNSLDESFSVTLMRLIDASGMTDAQVYRKANLSRQHFSKIRGNACYQPTKRTVLALCVALRLDLEQTKDLLSRAGFSLSHANVFDVIVEYFITVRNYDIFEINKVLFAYDQAILG